MKTHTMMKIVKSLEVARIVILTACFYMAYDVSKAPLTWIVAALPIAVIGLTGLESLLFPKAAALMKDREPGSAYQIQSGFNNLAVAITGIFVLVMQYTAQAQATIILVALIFLLLSSLNHAREYFIEKKSWIHLQRFILTVALWVGTIPLIIQELP